MAAFRLLCVLSLVCWSNQEPIPLKTCAHDGRPMVETNQGFICGTHCPDGPVEVCGKKYEDREIRNYKAYTGIPFAKPPIGELRFKNPVPGEPWSDYRDGSWMPPSCPQFDMELFLQGNMTATGQEDCLFLNVYVPEVATPDSGFPVMVWIHGGGFTLGNIQEYYANKLMKRDIILVSIQYRLGLLGWLSTDDEIAPGNLAIKDQELSLRWVQDNIAPFGGDPKKVTIFGESAGAISVHFQMLNPQAKGLFSRAILQSGTALMDLYEIPNHREHTYEVAKRMGCSMQRDNYNSEELIKCLQEVSALSLVDIAISFTKWGQWSYFFSPRYGEASLPDVPSRLLRDGEYNMVDIMMGINQHEGALFPKMLFMQPDAFKDIATNFSNVGHYTFYMSQDKVDIAKQIYEYYLGEIREYNEDDLYRMTEMYGDYYFDMPHDYSIELHSRDALYGKNIYAYELKHKGAEGLGAFIAPHIGKDCINHGDDLLYLFDFTFFNDSSKPEDKKLESIMLDLWTNFANYGNPTPDRSLGFTWKAITPGSTDHLVLKPEPYMEADTRCQRRKFFTTLNIDCNQHLFQDRIAAGPQWKPWKIDELKKC